jgi:hypothetical protein
VNDLKTVFERFPYGRGPQTFHSNLSSLVGAIREDLDVPCRIYLPA